MDFQMFARIVVGMSWIYDANFHTFLRVIMFMGWIYALVLAVKILRTGYVTVAAGPAPRWLPWYLIISSTVVQAVLQFWFIPMM